MDSDTQRDQGDVDAYWRRRVYVLAAGIAAIGLMAWACSDSGDHKSTAQVRNAAATMSPSPAAAVTMPGPTTTVTVTVTPTAAAAGPRRGGDRCDDADVVLTLTPAGGLFTGREHPVFRLAVVNTGRRACTLDVGNRALRVHITSGDDRIWSSERCGAGPGSDIRLLQRGVPYIVTLDWDRRRCGGERARPGTYVISARDGAITAKREVFRLR